MKYIQYKIEIKLSLLIVFFISALLGVQAQSNLTNVLGVHPDNDKIAFLRPPKEYTFMGIQRSLRKASADCFLITADLGTNDFSHLQHNGNTQPVYSWKLDEKLVYEIGVRRIEGGFLRWYVLRPMGPAKITEKDGVLLNYEIYDDLGVDGKFTFIFGHHFTAIAVDDGDRNFKLTPVYFGMDSNTGFFRTHMGVLTGEVELEDIPIINFKLYKQSNVYKMNGTAKMATIIKALNSNKENISNAKMANTKKTVLSVEEVENMQIENFKLYPNPSNGIFHLDFVLKENSIIGFKIFNLNGQIVYAEKEKEFTKGNKKYIFKNSNKLSTGTYILKVTSSMHSKSIRLIIN